MRLVCGIVLKEIEAFQFMWFVWSSCDAVCPLLYQLSLVCCGPPWPEGSLAKCKILTAYKPAPVYLNIFSIMGTSWSIAIVCDVWDAHKGSDTLHCLRVSACLKLSAWKARYNIFVFWRCVMVNHMTGFCIFTTAGKFSWSVPSIVPVMCRKTRQS